MMFRTKQALSEKQSPSRAPELPALKRANDQAMIYFNDIQARPILLSLVVGHGWIIRDSKLVSVVCDLPCAPDFLFNWFDVHVSKTDVFHECASAQLVCTEMCSSNGDETCCDYVKRDIEKYDK